MLFQLLFTVLCFVKDLWLRSFFDTYSRPIFALTWRSLRAHLGQKVYKTNTFTALAHKLDFKVFLNHSDTTCNVNAAKTIAQSVRFYRACQTWKTVFRLRLCGQIKGGAVQKTNRKRRNRLTNQQVQDNAFLLKQQRNMVRNLLVFNDLYEDFEGKTGLRKTTPLRHLCDTFESNKNTFIDTESAHFDTRSCHLDPGS